MESNPISPSTVPSSSSNPITSTSTSISNPPALKSLILDAAPLLTQQPSLSEPILATNYYIPPLVLEELKDERSRQYYQSLKRKGVQITVMDPPIEALAKVIAFSKKTGDYSVLSPPDLSVLALAYSIEVQAHGTWRIREEVGGPTGQQKHEAERLRMKKASEASSGPTSNSESSSKSLAQVVESIQEPSASTNIHTTQDSKVETSKVESESERKQEPEVDLETETETEDFEDATSDFKELSIQDAVSDSSNPTQEIEVRIDEEEEEEELDSEDDEVNGGEWITSDNLNQHQARSLGLIPAEESSVQELAGSKLQSQSQSQDQSSSSSVFDSSSQAGGGEAEEGWEVPKSKKKSNTNSNSNHGGTFGAPNLGGGSKKKGNKSNKTDIATLTADYAVQNVLLQMGLGLVGAGGLRIKSVRSWVLRCHGCYKICKDPSRKFCPTCGNPTLLRTSVTSRDPSSTKISSGPGALSAASAGVDLHLQKNFVYHNRGTKYSLPKPKAGSSSQRFGTNKVPILREDQSEWIKAVAKEKVRQNKEDRALQKAVDKSDKRAKEAEEMGKEGNTTSAFGLRYEDPDWMPEMLLGGKSSKNQGGLPKLGIGRKNPNERRRPKK